MNIYLIKFITGGKELTDETLLKVALTISKRSDVMRLGMIGLKMKSNEVNISLNNNSEDVTMATNDVLEKWNTSQSNSRSAYMSLRGALKVVNMNSVIDEVFEN